MTKLNSRSAARSDNRLDNSMPGKYCIKIYVIICCDILICVPRGCISVKHGRSLNCDKLISLRHMTFFDGERVFITGYGIWSSRNNEYCPFELM